MTSKNNQTIVAQGINIAVSPSSDTTDYISITDIAKAAGGESRAADVIKNWMRTRTTIEFLGTWEELYNPSFKVVEFNHFKTQAGLPTFVLSPTLWIEKTGAIGMCTKSGRYGGGTFAHQDIAFEFGSAISPIFRLFLIKEFQRLKEDEQRLVSAEWNLQRMLAKINYRIHTDAIKEQLVPSVVSKAQVNHLYANEADLLSVALFGKTAVEWRRANPDAKGNIRDNATLEQLVVLSNMESINALLIRQELPQKERLAQLN